jgi:AcrR family transcriptional regulator
MKDLVKPFPEPLFGFLFIFHIPDRKIFLRCLHHVNGHIFQENAPAGKRKPVEITAVKKIKGRPACFGSMGAHFPEVGVNMNCSIVVPQLLNNDGKQFFQLFHRLVCLVANGLHIHNSVISQICPVYFQSLIYLVVSRGSRLVLRHKKVFQHATNLYICNKKNNFITDFRVSAIIEGMSVETLKNSHKMEEKIISAYVTYLLEKNERPLSVYQFAQGAGMSEGEIYEYFSSFDAVDNQIMLNFFNAAVKDAGAKPGYADSSAREKLKMFFHAWIAQLKNNRSLIRIISKKETVKLGITPPFMESLKKEFRQYTESILVKAEEKGEIENRRLISDRYADGIWLQLLFIYRFWLKDDSKQFEKTGQAIDKSVDLSFDLMAKTSLDSAIDLGKFLFNNFKL